MSYKLYLDDVRAVPSKNWVVVRSYREFVEYIIKNGISEAVSFDHDLGREYHIIKEITIAASSPLTSFPIDYNSYKEKTGYHAAKWLVGVCALQNVPFPRYFIHSNNPIGKKNIRSYIEFFKKKSTDEI